MKTRSLLISYAGYPFTPSSLMPDNGLANLAGALIEHGHETVILDYGTIDTIRRLYPERLSKRAQAFSEKVFADPDQKYKPGIKDFLFLKYLDRQLNKHQKREIHKIAAEIIGKIIKYKPDFIGFKLWTGDGFSGSVQIARTIKSSFHHLPIFAGGPHVDMFRGLILEKYDVFDALVYGEGEETIVGIAEHIRNQMEFETIPNLIFKDNGTKKVTGTKWIEKLDELPYPVYDKVIYPSLEDNQKIKIVPFDESRGCFMGCFFCAHARKSGKRLRMKSIERIVDEIKHLKKKHGFSAFRYAGSATPTRLARKIGERLHQEKIDIQYSMFGNIRISRSDDFTSLKESGCRAIFFGLESGNQDILDKSMGKRFQLAEAEQILKSCQASGIFTITSIIFPAPFESDVSRKQTFNFLQSIRPDSVIVTFPILIPNTAWAADPEQFNFKVKMNEYLRKNMDYKIKWLFPPRFWHPLPYRLNKQKFRTFTAETSDFVDSLSKTGLVTGTSDELVLMAHFSGYKKREQDFLNLVRKLFFSGKWEKIKDLTKTINTVITKESLPHRK